MKRSSEEIFQKWGGGVEIKVEGGIEKFDLHFQIMWGKGGMVNAF